MGKALLLTCLGALVGCAAGPASSAGEPGPDASTGPPQDDGGSDAAKADDIDAGPSGTRLVVVHTGEPKLQPFRVCLGDAALPEPSDPTHPMPKSNYPGIAVGGAAYVGVAPGGAFSITLFDALTLANENRLTETCGELRTDATVPAFAREDVDTTGLSLSPGMLNVLGIYRQLGQTKAIAAPLDSAFANPLQPLRVAFGHLSPDHEGTKIAAAFTGRDGGASMPLGTAAFGTVGLLTTTTFPLDASASSYDDYGISLGSPARFFSLTDVAQGTDSTQTPSALLGGRSNFAFVLVGYDAIPDGGSAEDQLHFVAIATPQ